MTTQINKKPIYFLQNFKKYSMVFQIDENQSSKITFSDYFSLNYLILLQFIFREMLAATKILREGELNFIRFIGDIQKNKISQISIRRALKNYDVKNMKINNITPLRAKNLYKSLYQKYERADNYKKIWLENQRRLFIYALSCYAYQNSLQISKLSQQDFTTLNKLFPLKQIDLIKFQSLSILKNSTKQSKWVEKQDLVLYDIVMKKQQNNQSLDWREISQLFFAVTSQQYFRTSKQCRQRWQNHLDPNKTKGKWQLQQDHILFTTVLQTGKKWSNIAKLLQGKKNQHMVKNRFKSMLHKIQKQLQQEDQNQQRKQIDLIKIIIKKINEKLSSVSSIYSVSLVSGNENNNIDENNNNNNKNNNKKAKGTHDNLDDSSACKQEQFDSISFIGNNNSNNIKRTRKNKIIQTNQSIQFPKKNIILLQNQKMQKVNQSNNNLNHLSKIIQCEKIKQLDVHGKQCNVGDGHKIQNQNILCEDSHNTKKSIQLENNTAGKFNDNNNDGIQGEQLYDRIHQHGAPIFGDNRFPSIFLDARSPVNSFLISPFPPGWTPTIFFVQDAQGQVSPQVGFSNFCSKFESDLHKFVESEDKK